MDITSPQPGDQQETKPVMPARGDRDSTKRGRGRGRRIPGAARWVIVLVVVAAFVGGAFLWEMRASAAGQQSMITVPVTQGDVNVTVQANGTVDARREETVT